MIKQGNDNVPLNMLTNGMSCLWPCLTNDATWNWQKPSQPMTGQLSNESCAAIGCKACIINITLVGQGPGNWQALKPQCSTLPTKNISPKEGTKCCSRAKQTLSTAYFICFIQKLTNSTKNFRISFSKINTEHTMCYGSHTWSIWMPHTSPTV